MLNLTPDDKRLTWRLSKDVHNKMQRIGKATGLSMEEAANIIIRHSDWEGHLRPFFESHLAKKRESEKVKKKAEEAVSKLSTEQMDKLSNISPEQLQAFLNQNS